MHPSEPGKPLESELHSAELLYFQNKTHLCDVGKKKIDERGFPSNAKLSLALEYVSEYPLSYP